MSASRDTRAPEFAILELVGYDRFPACSRARCIALK